MREESLVKNYLKNICMILYGFQLSSVFLEGFFGGFHFFDLSEGFRLV